MRSMETPPQFRKVKLTDAERKERDRRAQEMIARARSRSQVRTATA